MPRWREQLDMSTPWREQLLAAEAVLFSRCECDKLPFPTLGAAQAGAERLQRETGRDLSPYSCGRQWHLTSQRTRYRRSERVA